MSFYRDRKKYVGSLKRWGFTNGGIWAKMII
jgi:hypothetical protein